MSQESREIMFGAVTVMVLAGVLAFLSAGRGVAAGQAGSYPVFATFNRVDGLLPGDLVRLGGIRIGKVEKAVLDPNYRARLTLSIDNAVSLPTDTSAAVQTDGLFGGKYIALLPGGEDKAIKPRGAITFTQDALIVSELLDLIIAEGRASRAKAAKAAKAAPEPAK